MIIKILPIKGGASGLGSTVVYAARDKNRIVDHVRQSFYNNLSSTDLNAIIDEFIKNYEDFAKKRDGNNTWGKQVILSYSPLDRDKLTIELMDAIAQHYIDIAFPKALVFGTHHIEEAHKHSHLIVSQNEFASSKSTRIGKAELKETYHSMLSYINEQHPELSVKVNEAAWGQKLHNEKEYFALKRDPDMQHIKSVMAEKIQGLFKMSQHTGDFCKHLEEAGFRTYNREDKPFGVLWGDKEDKMMRFSRLGIEQDQLEALDVQHEQLKELEAMQPPIEPEEQQEQNLTIDR